MTYGNEPRRKRSSGSSRRDETDEADNWLAGLRGGRGDEPDPFSSPADPFDEPSRGPASTLRSTEPPFEPTTRPFQAPSGRSAPPTYDDSSPVAQSNGASRAAAVPPLSGRGAAGSAFPAQAPPLDDESPSRGVGRRRARDGDELPSRARRVDDESPSRGRRVDGFAAGGYEEPPSFRPPVPEDGGAGRGYPGPAYVPPPANGGYGYPADEPTGYGRRARPDDESPSVGRRARPDDDRGTPQQRGADYDTPSGRVGRRRARDEDEVPDGRFSAPEAPGRFNGFSPASPPNGFAGPAADRYDAPVPDRFDAPAPDRFAGPPADRFDGPGGRGGFGGPEAPAARTFEASTSYDHGPVLEPIIKPLHTVPVPPPDEPPPLVPIFPGLSEPAPVRDEPVRPVADDARLARRVRGDQIDPRIADPRGPDPRSGDLRGAEPRSGDLRGPDFRSGDPRGAEPRSGDLRGAEPRSGDLRIGDPRSGDIHGSDLRGAGLESRTGDPRTRDRDGRGLGYGDDRSGFAGEAPATQVWRSGAAVDAPARGDGYPPAGPYPPVDRPRRSGPPPDTFRSGGDYSGEFTSGGTRRPPRQPGGTGTLDRPAGPAGRGPRGGTATVDPVTVGAQHRPHKWIALISVIGVLALVAVCGLGTWFMINDERKGPAGTQAAASASPASRDISSRTADPAPLTQAEVFPAQTIVAAPNEAPYMILTTAIAPDCSSGATDDLAKLLASAGCNQVVRGTMKSPTGDYLVTAGLFNLNDQTAAENAFKGVKAIVDAQKGRFVGMSAGTGTGTDAIVRAPTQLSWNYRGHFIAYAVIARTDGQAFAQNDPYPNQITFDIVETYLENGIIGARATVPAKPSAAASILPPAPGKS